MAIESDGKAVWQVRVLTSSGELVEVLEDEEDPPITQESWFVGVVAGGSAVILCLCCVLCCFWCRTAPLEDKQVVPVDNDEEAVR